MWIQVRSMDGSCSTRVDGLSKLTKIEELRERLVEHFNAEPSRQRLFYRGKQLEDGHSLFDYDVGLNDIVQLMVRPVVTLPAPLHPPAVTDIGSTSAAQNGNETHRAENGTDCATDYDSTTENTEQQDSVEEEQNQTGLYKVKDKVDARDLRMGAWFEAEVVKVTKEAPPTHNGASGSRQELDEPVTYYHVKFDDYSEDDVTQLTATDIRPRACYRLQWDQLATGSTVMVNYNPDHPTQRGFWYDAVITRKDDKKLEVFAKLVLNAHGTADAQQEIQVTFVDEIFRIETKTQSNSDPRSGGVARTKKPDCDWCKDNLRRKCKHCACCVCGGKERPEKQILCDECNMAYHLWCLAPKLEAVPEEDWYCPSCKNDSSEVIAAGEMKLSKKKANSVCKKSSSNRNWGNGMACVGRTKTCTIVPKSHFGPIPGVPVGTLWKYRMQCAESGVHRHSVGGIHGRTNTGAYSIVLSGGYEDDTDNGEEFTYSGSGGRDLSGNKRTASAQSCDQKLTRMNRALALNCDAPVDDKNGAMAKDWRKGKPVRVVRNHKGSKRSTYAPKEGNRYDGIYKVVKYWPEKSKTTGFIMWKYLLRRDDPSPAPWTKEGEKMAEKIGLTMQFPDGYLEGQAANNEEENEEDDKPKKRGRKRKSENTAPLTTPSSKQPRYELSKQHLALIKKDSANVKLWTELLEETGSAGLLQRIKDRFSCIVCQELVCEPITTACLHNVCKTCLSRSFQAELYTCPCCRHDLGKSYNMSQNLNKPLQSVLLDLFPGYSGGR